ncbi:hypothetical protein ACFFP0_20730 [Rhizobium puerariae]|uniref:DUF680 domain-containing protein n=1 Tax=Rhizobium puerariae TaxID=1585791 RepID=A0ABV6APN6_9HYPH
MTRIAPALVAAMIATASFAGAALAGNGDYYEGIDRNGTSAPANHNVVPAARSHVDTFATGSIGDSRAAVRFHSTNGQIEQSPNRGDYYEGVNRPN